MEDDLKKKKKKKRPTKKLFSISPKFRGKPFLGLAQLSKIFFYLNLGQDLLPYNANESNNLIQKCSKETKL